MDDEAVGSCRAGAVAAMLSHALTSTALNTYAHALPGSDRPTGEAMERLVR